MKNQNIYKLDAHTLRVFLKVCELQSVSRAADYFDLNQSTVSNMLDRLRQMVGFRLFEKSGRNIVPTTNAKDLIPRAHRIVSAIEGLPDSGEYHPKEDARPVTIAANVNSMIGPLLAVRESIWNDCPDRPVRILELGSRDQIENTLETSQADFVIAVRTPRYPLMVNSRPFFEDASVVFYDPSQREAPASSEEYFNARHGVLDFGGHVRSTIDTEVRRLQAHRNIVCSASNASMLAEMIRGTDIIVSLPSHLRFNVLRDFEYATLPYLNEAPLFFDLLWHKRHAESSRHKWLRDVVAKARVEDFLNPDAAASAQAANSI